MNNPLTLGRFSLGVGDRFAHQAKAQLRACIQAAAAGVEVIPVWNKSFREHSIVGSCPGSVRQAAEAAVKELQWPRPFYIDADHIRLETVGSFIKNSDFYTLDVADTIGQMVDRKSLEEFVGKHHELIGALKIPGIDRPISTTCRDIEEIGQKYLAAIQEAGRLYRHIESQKGKDNFVTEVSMDETDNPQSPVELLVILAAIADQDIPLQTIAPKFTGRFNKGVDYVGDVIQFEKEFNEDLNVIAYAVSVYDLPPNLKLSVHSGSDKFSIYEPIRSALVNHSAGVHLKTAGTTWLEELIGLAESDGEGLALAKEIYGAALDEIDALCQPYASVIDIDRCRLPAKDMVEGWSAQQFVNALRHNPNCSEYNPNLRQLLHVGYKVAAKLGDRYLDMLDRCEEAISRNVTENLYERHLRPLFIGAGAKTQQQSSS